MNTEVTTRSSAAENNSPLAGFLLPRNYPEKEKESRVDSYFDMMEAEWYGRLPLTYREQTIAHPEKESKIAETKSQTDLGVEKQDINKYVDRLIHRIEPQINAQAQLLIRKTLGKELLLSLMKLKENLSEITVSAYAGKLLRTLRMIRDVAPLDPFVKVSLAFYDSLAFNNQWRSYTEKQYEGAYSILRTILRQKSLEAKDISKAIVSLDSLGFNSLPFALNIGEEE